MLKRIEQVVQEDEYSRRNIREKVMQTIEEEKEDDLKDTFKQYCDSLDQWLMDESEYESKDFRKVTIAAKGVENVVTEVLLAVLSCKGVTPIQAVVAKIEPYLGFEDPFVGVKAAAEVLAVCWDSKLFKVYGDPLRIAPQFQLPKAILDFIENTKYMNPMLCEPNEWSSNYSGGYLTICEHVILGRHNNHQEKQALDALNIVQAIEWELDDIAVNYVEKPKHVLDTVEKVTAWNHHIVMSTDVYQQMMDAGNSFWFPWKYDFRGRMYSQGHYVNLQSTGYKKSLLNFKHRELIQ